MTVTQQAFAATNLNNSPTDINNQIESNGDQDISGDNTITQSDTITTEITQSADTDCSADGEGAEVNCNVSQESNRAGSSVDHGTVNTNRNGIDADPIPGVPCGGPLNPHAEAC
jgi:hypothetical protein